MPLETTRYDFLALDTVRRQTAGLSKVILQESTWLSRQGLAGFKTFTPAPTKIIDVVYLHRMLAEIKTHSESHYSDLMLDFKVCQQMQSRGLEATAQQHRAALQLVTAERNAAAARFWVLFRKQPAIRQQYIQVCILVLMISHSEHAKVLDTFSKAALEVEDLHKQELAAKEKLLQEKTTQVTQHRQELAGKDEAALKEAKEHRKQTARAASTHASLNQQHESLIEQHESLIKEHAALKRQHKSDAMDHMEQREADAEAKEDYIRAHEGIMYEMEQEHAQEIAKLQADHAAEKWRLELRIEKLSDKCKAVNFLRRTSEEQNVQATTLRQLNEAESGLRHLTGKVRPAMKRLAESFNEQSHLFQDHHAFSVKLWHGYLQLTEQLNVPPRQDLADDAKVHLALNARGEKTRRNIFFPILDMTSLLGLFYLPGVRKAGDPPRITSLAWGVMVPPVDAPVETFIEWLVEEDFTAERWGSLRQLAYKLARVSSPYGIQWILAKCHELRRSDWADQ